MLHLHTCTGPAPPGCPPRASGPLQRWLRPAATVAPPGGESTDLNSCPPVCSELVCSGLLGGPMSSHTVCTRRGEHPNHHWFHLAWSRLYRSMTLTRGLNPAPGAPGANLIRCPQRRAAPMSPELWAWGRQPPAVGLQPLSRPWWAQSPFASL